MGRAEGYRGEPERVERLPPRALAWKWSAARVGGLFPLVMCCLHILGGVIALLSVPLHVVTLAFGETRDAPVTSAEITTGPKGARYYDVGFSHEVDGMALPGRRSFRLDRLEAPPPGVVVSVGEATTVICFKLGSFHVDDLAMPHESAFHRRASELVTHAFGAGFAFLFLSGIWYLQFRPGLRERALLREGVLAVGTVTGKLITPGRKNREKRKLSYTFEGSDGLPRNGTCDARDADAFARLSVGDIINVLYDPRDWHQSQAYETAAFTFAGEARKLLTEPAPKLGAR